MAENPAHSNNGEQLWARVLQNVAQKVDPHSFETWFRPVVFVGWNETSCRLVVPNPFFRRCFLEIYSGLLNRTIEQLLDAPVALQVSAAETETTTSGALPVRHASELERETAQNPG